MLPEVGIREEWPKAGVWSSRVPLCASKRVHEERNSGIRCDAGIRDGSRQRLAFGDLRPEPIVELAQPAVRTRGKTSLIVTVSNRWLKPRSPSFLICDWGGRSRHRGLVALGPISISTRFCCFESENRSKFGAIDVLTEQRPGGRARHGWLPRPRSGAGTHVLLFDALTLAQLNWGSRDAARVAAPVRRVSWQCSRPSCPAFSGSRGPAGP